MTRLPNKETAIATLKANGYVRLGDHSATTMDTLEEVYATRHDAWTEVEKKGIHLPSPSVSALDAGALAAAIVAGLVGAKKAIEAEEDAETTSLTATASEPEQEKEPADDGLDGMTLPELRAKALDLGIPEFPVVGTSRKQVIEAMRSLAA